MTNSAKIGLGIGILGGAVGAYFLIQYLLLKKKYTTTLSAPDAAILIQQKTQAVGDNIIPDDVTANADAFKGTEIDEQTGSLQQFDIQSGMGDL
jgi:hypothetical protein